MLALVRAIKFAKPDASMRAVHREITQDLSKKEGFGFLKDVELKDVKKVWKKAVAEAEGGTVADDSGDTKTNDGNRKDPGKDGIGGSTAKSDDILRLYTVGDGSVQMLAENYSRSVASKQAEATAPQGVDLSNYVHVFLDVPADRSGSRPHQALINIQQNNSGKKANKSGKGKKKNKGKAKSTTGGSEDGNENHEDDGDEDGEIVKIQVAASSNRTKFPMLMYNADRTKRTFIHSDSDDEENGEAENGYDKIFNMITQQGQGGALGSNGGAKAYFYSRSSGSNILSIDITRLAPPQAW